MPTSEGIKADVISGKLSPGYLPNEQWCQSELSRGHILWLEALLPCSVTVSLETKRWLCPRRKGSLLFRAMKHYLPQMSKSAEFISLKAQLTISLQVQSTNYISATVGGTEKYTCLSNFLLFWLLSFPVIHSIFTRLYFFRWGLFFRFSMFQKK